MKESLNLYNKRKTGKYFPVHVRQRFYLKKKHKNERKTFSKFTISQRTFANFHSFLQIAFVEPTHRLVKHEKVISYRIFIKILQLKPPIKNGYVFVCGAFEAVEVKIEFIKRSSETTYIHPHFVGFAFVVHLDV